MWRINQTFSNSIINFWGHEEFWDVRFDDGKLLPTFEVLLRSWWSRPWRGYSSCVLRSMGDEGGAWQDVMCIQRHKLFRKGRNTIPRFCGYSGTIVAKIISDKIYNNGNSDWFELSIVVFIPNIERISMRNVLNVLDSRLLLIWNC